MGVGMGGRAGACVGVMVNCMPLCPSGVGCLHGTVITHYVSSCQIVLVGTNQRAWRKWKVFVSTQSLERGCMKGITYMKGYADVGVYIIYGCVGIKGLHTYGMCGYKGEAYWYIKPDQLPPH